MATLKKGHGGLAFLWVCVEASGVNHRDGIRAANWNEQPWFPYWPPPVFSSFRKGHNFQKRIVCSWAGEILSSPSLCSWSLPFLFCDWEGAVINELEALGEFEPFEGLRSPADSDKWRQVGEHWKVFIWTMVNRPVYRLGQGQRPLFCRWLCLKCIQTIQ